MAYTVSLAGAHKETPKREAQPKRLGYLSGFVIAEYEQIGKRSLHDTS